MDEYAFGNCEDFLLGLFGESEGEVFDGFVASFSGEFPHESTVSGAGAFDLLGGFAF